MKVLLIEEEIKAVQSLAKVLKENHIEVGIGKKCNSHELKNPLKGII